MQTKVHLSQGCEVGLRLVQNYTLYSSFFLKFLIIRSAFRENTAKQHLSHRSGTKVEKLIVNFNLCHRFSEVATEQTAHVLFESVMVNAVGPW